MRITIREIMKKIMYKIFSNDNMRYLLVPIVLIGVAFLGWLSLIIAYLLPTDRIAGNVVGGGRNTIS